MRRIGRGFVRLNDLFAERSGQVLSWSVWLTLMVFGTALWFVFNLILPHPFDRGPDYPRLVLILTITTALDASATKLFQLSLRRTDAVRDELVQSQVEHTAELTIAIHGELERSRARDEAMQATLDRVLDAIEAPEGDTT